MSRRRLPAVAAPLGALVLVAALTGCSPQPSISVNNGAVNGCYRAFPVAVAALHTHSRPQFRGVHRVAADTIEKRFPQVTLPPGDNDTVVCAFAFHGAFRPGQVELAPPTEQGSYAVVLVGSRHLRLVASYVGNRLPERFGRRIAA